MHINSRTDIETWVDNANPHNCLTDSDGGRRAVAALQSADHPPYGSDWGEWLAAESDAIVASAMADDRSSIDRATGAVSL